MNKWMVHIQAGTWRGRERSDNLSVGRTITEDVDRMFVAMTSLSLSLSLCACERERVVCVDVSLCV